MTRKVLKVEQATAACETFIRNHVEKVPLGIGALEKDHYALAMNAIITSMRAAFAAGYIAGLDQK